jgi:LPXTG-motif cell wall-anchored protein
MRSFARVSAVLIAGTLALSHPALAQNNNNQGGNNNNQGGVRGAPGPLIGTGLAGLPVLLIGGIYWVAKRRKKAS